jgi:uncharacterized protein (TIGR00255 family)
MTGFGVATQDFPSGALSLEIRSVNSRFLDLSFRMSDEMRGFEPGLRDLIAAVVTRGKVEVRLGFGRETASRSPRPLAINEAAVTRLAAAAAQVRTLMPQAREPGILDVLQWPGVLEEPAVSPDALKNATMALAAKALAEFRSSREREGDKLKAMLLQRVDSIGEWARRIEPILPRIVADHHSKLVGRLRDALGSVDDERVKQEVALFGIRIDVAEELSRLEAHLGEVRRVLERGGACGKRLDFLMQELHREANTLGSKSVSIDVSAGAMEIKILIEQMREQVQNLE